jgi:hypothetical protein
MFPTHGGLGTSPRPAPAGLHHRKLVGMLVFDGSAARSGVYQACTASLLNPVTILSAAHVSLRGCRPTCQCLRKAWKNSEVRLRRGACVDATCSASR